MSGANFSGTFQQAGQRIRTNIAAERKLAERVTLLRILTRRPSESPAWATPFPRRSA